MIFTIKLCTYAKLNFLNRTVHLYKIDLELNYLLRLICYKMQRDKQITLLFLFAYRWFHVLL